MKLQIGFVLGLAIGAAGCFFWYGGAGIRLVPGVEDRNALIDAILESVGATGTANQMVERAVASALKERQSKIPAATFESSQKDQLVVLKRPVEAFFRASYEGLSNDELKQYLACVRSPAMEKQRRRFSEDMSGIESVHSTLRQAVQALVDKNLNSHP